MHAEKYQIKNVEYTSKGAFGVGTTNSYALEQKVDINKKRIFDDEEAFLKYKDDYIQRLKNTQVFHKIEVD